MAGLSLACPLAAPRRHRPFPRPLSHPQRSPAGVSPVVPLAVPEAGGGRGGRSCPPLAART